MKLKIIFTLLVFALPIKAFAVTVPQADFNQFQSAMHQSIENIDRYEYDLAWKSFNTAEWYFRQVIAKMEKAEPKGYEAAGLESAMLTNLIPQCLTIGRRYHDTKKYQNALAVYARCKNLGAHASVFPLIRYEWAFTLLNMGNKAEAQKKYYEARLYSRDPDNCQIKNPYDDSGTVMVNCDEINHKSGLALIDMGFPENQPLQQFEVMPRIGANIRDAKGILFSLYLRQQASVLERMGTPSDSFEMEFNGQSGVMQYFPESKNFIFVRNKDKTIYTIMTCEPQSHLKFDQTFYVGDPVAKLIKTFNTLARKTTVEPSGIGAIREILSYDEFFGFEFGISTDDHIACIIIRDTSQ